MKIAAGKITLLRLPAALLPMSQQRFVMIALIDVMSASNTTTETIAMSNTIEIFGEQYTLETDKTYSQNGQPVIEISDIQGMPSGIITVCIPGHPFAANETAISSDVDQSSVVSQLVQMGIAKDTGNIAVSGYGRYPVIELIEQQQEAE